MFGETSQRHVSLVTHGTQHADVHAIPGDALIALGTLAFAVVVESGCPPRNFMAAFGQSPREDTGAQKSRVTRVNERQWFADGKEPDPHDFGRAMRSQFFFNASISPRK
jgi:hypothetical protein